MASVASASNKIPFRLSLCAVVRNQSGFLKSRNLHPDHITLLLNLTQLVPPEPLGVQMLDASQAQDAGITLLTTGTSEISRSGNVHAQLSADASSSPSAWSRVNTRHAARLQADVNATTCCVLVQCTRMLTPIRFQRHGGASQGISSVLRNPKHTDSRRISKTRAPKPSISRPGLAMDFSNGRFPCEGRRPEAVPFLVVSFSVPATIVDWG